MQPVGQRQYPQVLLRCFPSLPPYPYPYPYPYGVPLKSAKTEKVGVKRKEAQEENTEAKRERRGAGEHHQRTEWFLVTEPNIRQQRIKVNKEKYYRRK